MPIVEITMIEGRTPEAKRRLIAKVTDAIIEAVEAPRDSIRIILREIPALHFGVGGKTKEKIEAPPDGVS
jgi:4-oxalocrotonate tautomerase